MRLLLCALAGLLPGIAWAQLQQDEEAIDYFNKWLSQDVVYIIAPEEKAVFEKLTTPEEKERFIEQFWLRRDPDPRTAENEFKIEHYRRIAYANERFTSGFEGWRTDRGRVYILHGPPAEIESHPSGGAYERTMNEGGGTTATYPFEIWRYRNIEGVGDDVELEFVDRSMSGEYRLALIPEEKDALLYVPGQGSTIAEALGLSTKADRTFFNPLNREGDPLAMRTSRDDPFYRWETYTQVQSPLPVKYQDLKELVEVNVQYNNLSTLVQTSYFNLDAQRLLVPVTVQIENRLLTFASEGELRVARVAIYGVITSITNRLIEEFEDDLITSAASDQFNRTLSKASIYQKMVVLERNQRYKLDLVVKDLSSGQVGVVRKAIVPPGNQENELSASSLILADSIEILKALPPENEMFLMGDVRVRPNLSRSFTAGRPLGLYFQVYNASVDQANMTPQLRITYLLFRDGQLLRKATDEHGESIQYFSPRRSVLLKLLSVDGLEPGPYLIRVEVEDRLSNQKLELTEPFSVRG